MILLVGLGNPGARYTATRHNVGVRVVERAVEVAGGGPWREKFHGRLAPLSLGGHAAAALCPETFMNESGRSVQPCAAFYKLGAPQVLLVHDELDLPFGELRLKQGGGDAGHRGIRSVSAALGPDTLRLRVGIGRPPPEFRGDVADFVLQAFAPQERAALDEVLARSVEAVTLVASRGIPEAMNVIHQRTSR
ncbi:MAG: aminoacyl-tRNA hydrolase [Myxococcales bacterium]|nr:aminoacyl-tRNA hydrolase [Myxococcales bacterium]